jgi:hypothetical protein
VIGSVESDVLTLDLGAAGFIAPSLRGMSSAEHRLRIQALDDHGFERLVHELLREETGRLGWRKMRAPDGGADSLVRGEAGTVDRVVQAKHYPSGITSAHWRECEISLATALATWEPARITFAFSCDFTKNNERDFSERLVAKAPSGVQVDALTLTDIERLVAKHSSVAARFLGQDSKSISEIVARSSRMAGAQLQDAGDLLARSDELAAFADETDPNFRYSQSSGPVEVPSPNWEQPPFVSLEVAGESRRVRLDAWPREGSEPEVPQVAFLANEDGRRAKEHVRTQLAAGVPATVDSGIQLVLPQGPRLIGELIAANPGDGKQATFPVPPPIPLEIVTRSERHGEITRSVSLRQVPPADNADAAFANLSDGLWLEITTDLGELPKVTANVTFGARFGTDASENANAARWLLALTENEEVELRSPLLPDSFGDDQLLQNIPFESEELRFRVDLYEAIMRIEEACGIQLEVPEIIDRDALNVIGTVDRVLRTRQGTATFHDARGVLPAEKLTNIEAAIHEAGSHRRPVTFELWGVELNLGLADYELPEIKVTKIRRLGPSPDSPAEVEVAAAGDGQMRFTLVEDGPPQSAAGGRLLG